MTAQPQPRYDIREIPAGDEIRLEWERNGVPDPLNFWYVPRHAVYEAKVAIRLGEMDGANPTYGRFPRYSDIGLYIGQCEECGAEPEYRPWTKPELARWRISEWLRALADWIEPE